MAEKADVKAEALPDLDDLLQCPVCYEIPSGQIFQCNEGHHVCGRCKVRLSQCPVCRALFFGTRNYAMEELIASVKKLRAFKLGGKVTTGSGSGSNTPAEEAASGEPENNAAEEENNVPAEEAMPLLRAPPACKGLFRCLCCKTSVRLPAGRLLNHLRYFHSPELLEGQSENGEYLQAWQFSTVPGRIVTAVRVADMGIFFLVIEINSDSIYAWLSMAAAPWVTNEFSYTVTISGNDREAIFSDCVWSVRSCEGFLKKRGRCLVVSGMDARALTAPDAISGKLSVQRRRPDEIHTDLAHPRAVLRVANRGDAPPPPVREPTLDLEPFLHDLQNDVARLSRAFAILDREGNTLSAPIENTSRNVQSVPLDTRPAATSSTSTTESMIFTPPDNPEQALSRNARRRMRQRLRAAFLEPPINPTITSNSDQVPRPRGQRLNGHIQNNTIEPHTLPPAQHVHTPVNILLGRRNNNLPDSVRIQSALSYLPPLATSYVHPAGTNLMYSNQNLQRIVPNNVVPIPSGLITVQQVQPCPHIINAIAQPAGAFQRQNTSHVPNAMRAERSDVQPLPATSPTVSGGGPGASNGQPQNETRTNKKKRRQRR